jgi:SecD/SecF fusion protein
MNQRTLKWRIPIVAFATAVCLLIVSPPFDPDGDGPLHGKLKLGLDLQGGMHLVLRVDTDKIPLDQREDATERALEVIRNRIDRFGVEEPSIQRQGKDQIVIQLPGITDRENALNLIGQTALLEFKLVADNQSLLSQENPQIPDGMRIYQQKEGPDILLEDATLVEGKSLVDAFFQHTGDFGEPGVSIRFNAEGGKNFATVTSRFTGRQLAIILDDVVLSAPVIREAILSGEAQITGSFSREEASLLAISLKAGALPAPIQIEEERSIGPTLGKDSIRQGIQATLYAGLAVVAFMAVYYLMAGLIADLALCLNILIIGACLAYAKATLTLPGIAGVILTIGMAVDMNVLIMERIREELRIGKKVQAAIASGYRRASTAIIDSNLTTLITALILIFLASGPVRGFALTLAIGIGASFFTGLFVTRVVFDIFLSARKFESLPMLSFIKKTPSIPFMKLRTLMFSLSAIIILGALYVSVTKVPEHLGVDFDGGVLQEYRFDNPVSVSEVREALYEGGYGKAVIQNYGNPHDIVIRSPEGSNEDIRRMIETQFVSNPHELRRIESVGPVIGRELRRKSLLAALFSLLSILVYLAFRFEFRYSIAAVLALIHDALVCLGAMVLTGRELSIPVLAALLTVVGYSVNDTIVNFDRIRENTKKGGKDPYDAIVNRSINETLSRTLLTSFTTLMVVVSLYFFGGTVINDFAFIMIVGVLSGTYSSLYVACPVVIAWPWRTKR